MAVIRSRKDEVPSEVGSTGDAGNSAPVAPVDRTRSAVAGKNTAATVAGRAPLERQGPRGPVARTTAAQQSGPTDVRGLINDTRAELNRVVWPTEEEVRSGTIVTVGLLVFFGLYIFVLDYAADWMFHALGLYVRASGTG
jgi:preprotein translocase SecE subunit